MRTSTILLAAGLAITGVASAVTLRSPAAPAASGEERHAGPDSARVEAFFAALHAADPMLCDMVTDQLGNFWNSMGDDRVGALADAATRRWEPVRDSLFSPVSDASARRRVARALGDDDPCVRRAASRSHGWPRSCRAPTIPPRPTPR